MNREKKKLGDLLIDVGIITKEQLDQVLSLQKMTKQKLGELLIEKGFVTEKQIIEVLEFQLGIPHMDLDKYFIDPNIPILISEGLAKRHIVIPVKRENNRLTVAMADPLNIFAIDDIQIATGLEIAPVISSRNQIDSAIEQYYGKQNAEQAIEEFKKEYNIDSINDLNEELISEISNAPVVRLVNSMIKQAVNSKASDIHIEPFENTIRIRYRIDGELQEMMSAEKSAHAAIITRIKIMGKMNIAEKRVPQDGRVETLIDNKPVDLRISVIPTVNGEKIVIRILDRSGFMKNKSQLGFIDENIALFDKIIKNTNGIILVTGPTGSGKSTTLYSVLNELNDINTNIVTVEDPVEFKVNGINQVQVNNKAGMTFASALRSILRQDPDIIMIGEIRDVETAQIAVRAAITGHLVLSTMHTNDAPSTVSRLVDMGVEPYLVSSSVVGVIAQRLVRKICSDCIYEYEPTKAEREFLGLEEGVRLKKGKGCSSCNSSGYKGRMAIHEIMPITREIRLMIDRRESIDIIRKEAIAQGIITLKDNCKRLVLEGLTTIDETYNVAYTLD